MKVHFLPDCPCKLFISFFVVGYFSRSLDKYFGLKLSFHWKMFSESFIEHGQGFFHNLPIFFTSFLENTSLFYCDIVKNFFSESEQQWGNLGYFKNGGVGGDRLSLSIQNRLREFVNVEGLCRIFVVAWLRWCLGWLGLCGLGLVELLWESFESFVN